jgi:hypothetical protein
MAMFWKRKETLLEKRLANISREMILVDADIDALSRTVRSGGRIPAPRGLRSEEWRRRQIAEAEAEMLPEWFPRSEDVCDETGRSERGLVRDERLVSYLASNFQTAPPQRAEESDAPADRRWVLVGMIVVLLLLYCLARHWL